MSEHITSVILIVTILLGLPLTILIARDWLSRPSKKQIQESARQFIRRLGNPDFSAVERHYGCPLPICVQLLYTNQEELMRSNFEIMKFIDAPEGERWYIANYEPADEASVEHSWPGIEKYFAFADDGLGNGYIIDPKETDPPVLFHDHETGEIVRVCDHFTDFMRWPRFIIN